MVKYKLIKNFITVEDSQQILEWVNSLKHTGNEPNYHLKELSKTLNGTSCIFDISNTEITNYITKFQSITDVSRDLLPNIIYNLIAKISDEFNISKDNIFLQVVDMRNGGKINPHYDSSVDGYINYKCNISVLSENYKIFIDKEYIDIQETDLYAFEASLYKHWTNKFNERRVLLSFGFLLKYSELNRDINDPRIRLSRRIEKYFQNKKQNK